MMKTLINKAIPWPTLIASLILSSMTACNTMDAPKPVAIAQQSAPLRLPLPMSSTLVEAKTDMTLLLNRLTWGANASSQAQLQTLGIANYLQQQLQGPVQALPASVQAQIDALSISTKPFASMMQELSAQRKAAAEMKGVDDTLRKAYQQELTRIAKEAASRSLLRAIYSPNQMLEQMDWFWMNHFNISNRKDNLRAMLGDFEEHAIRPHALGNFRDLLRATMLHPAMLRYLDNEHNANGKINENYARELMELHTMGVGSGYTQNDVQELARVLTGLGIRIRDEKNRSVTRHGVAQEALVEFNSSRHDFGEKLILGQRITGSGAAELDQVLNLLTRQPATAQFISRKLALYFVSDVPSEALITHMANTFLRADGDIPSVLMSMFESPEFVASLGQKFKDPMHYVISSLRLSYGDASASRAIVNTAPILNWLTNLGQQPNGHLTPDGYSLLENAWDSPAQMTTRFDVAKSIANGAPKLFLADSDADEIPKSDRVVARELAQISLGKNAYVAKWSETLSPSSREALSQSATAQEWNTLFLSAPEMMRR